MGALRWPLQSTVLVLVRDKCPSVGCILCIDNLYSGMGSRYLEKVMEKTPIEVTAVAHVEVIGVLPRTLEVVAEQMKIPGADATMYVVYGKDVSDRKVWCATFFDSDEAMAWVHGSRIFGRPVNGAVMAGQDKKPDPTIEVADGPGIHGREQADKAN